MLFLFLIAKVEFVPLYFLSRIVTMLSVQRAREPGVSELPPQHLTEQEPRSRRRQELLTFLVLAFGIWPLVAVGVVGGYGFIVWMLQIVYGPPGPLGH
jgi:nitrate reductase NapE